MNSFFQFRIIDTHTRLCIVKSVIIWPIAHFRSIVYLFTSISLFCSLQFLCFHAVNFAFRLLNLIELVGGPLLFKTNQFDIFSGKIYKFESYNRNSCAKAY